jgi:hypothetical protein
MVTYQSLGRPPQRTNQWTDCKGLARSLPSRLTRGSEVRDRAVKRIDEPPGGFRAEP